jgi:hypothetical protein
MRRLALINRGNAALSAKTGRIDSKAAAPVADKRLAAPPAREEETNEPIG